MFDRRIAYNEVLVSGLLFLNGLQIGNQIVDLLFPSSIRPIPFLSLALALLVYEGAP